MAPLLLLLLATLSAPAGQGVVVVQSDDIAAYTEPVPAFLDELGRPAAVVNLHGRRSEADALVRRLRREDPEAVFCLGAKAAWAIHQGLPLTPMVYAVVLNPERYGIEGPQIAGVSMQVAPELHLSNFTGFFPSVRTLGVLRGPSLSESELADLRRGADAVGLDLVVEEVDSPRRVRSTFAGMAPRIDALWLQPDRDMLTSDSFRALTEEATRRRLPLLVETDNMVRAGGLFAVVPEPGGLGRQAARMVERILEGAAPAILGVEDPEEVRVVMNLRTLRRAELELDELLLDFVDEVVE